MPPALSTAPPSLVADIGGTNTRMALTTGDGYLADTVRRYKNAEHPGFEDVVKHYMADQGLTRTGGICVALAGPVRDGYGQMTNLDWTIAAPVLAQVAGTDRVAVLNDLQAQGHALGHLAPGMVQDIKPGATAAAQATRLVVGIGTGFNIAVVLDTGTGRHVTPSEAGHTIPPIQTSDELALAKFVAHDGHTAVEELLSGRGLENIHAWVTHRAGGSGRSSAADIMTALSDQDPAAQETLRIFTRLLGQQAGDLALLTLPFGGIYLVGGVARAIAPHLADNGFAAAFRDKGRFADFMDAFPVQLVNDDYAALTGCAMYLAKA